VSAPVLIGFTIPVLAGSAIRLRQHYDPDTYGTVGISGDGNLPLYGGDSSRRFYTEVKISAAGDSRSEPIGINAPYSNDINLNDSFLDVSNMRGGNSTRPDADSDQIRNGLVSTDEGCGRFRVLRREDPIAGRYAVLGDIFNEVLSFSPRALTNNEVQQLVTVATLWPTEYADLLEELLIKIKGMNEDAERPYSWVLHITAKVVRISQYHKAKPTDIAPLLEGGVGVAWNTSKSYADVEIQNSGAIDFSISKNRKNMEFISFSVLDNEAPEEIAGVVERINKVVADAE